MNPKKTYTNSLLKPASGNFLGQGLKMPTNTVGTAGTANTSNAKLNLSNNSAILGNVMQGGTSTGSKLTVSGMPTVNSLATSAQSKIGAPNQYGPVVPSNTSATGTNATKITSPAGQNYMSTIQDSPVSPVTTPSKTDTSYQNTPEYKAYLKYQREKENPTEASDARKSYEASMQRYADVQNENERRAYELKKEQNDILDASGGLRSGAIDSANMKGRRANDELSRLALEESAAARSAGVAQTNYQPFLDQEKENAKPLSYEEAQSLGVVYGTTVGEAKALGKIPEAKGKDGFSLGKDQTRYEYNSSTGTYEAVGGGSVGGGYGGGYIVGADPTVDAYIKGIQDGTYKPSDIPNEYQDAVAQGITQTDKPQSEISKQAIGVIDELLANPKLDRIFGPVDQFVGGIFGDAALAKNKYNQLKGLLSLDNIKYLKGTGAISDAEQRLLANAASALGRNLGNAQARTTLENLKRDLNSLNTVGETLEPDEEEYLRSQGYSQDDIDAFKQSFSSVGNTSVSIPQSSRLAYINNNPGNLRFAGQNGATQGEGGFAQFPTAEAGLQALQKQIQLDASRGLTLAQFINKYAPLTENDTQRYIQDVIASTGASSMTPLNQINLTSLTKAIALKESGTQIYG